MKAVAAEFLGTFWLVFIGCGSVVLFEVYPGFPNVGIAIGFGVAVCSAILLFGKASGAHINPAVSLLFLIKKEMTLGLFGTYLAAQLLGAAVASLFLDGLFPGTSLGVTLPAGSWQVSFGIELVFTALLGLGILLLRHRVSLWQLALAIGTLIGLEAYFGGPISGASMNPARSFGPSLIAGNWDAHSLYWLAPMLGMLLAHVTFQILPKK